MSREQARCIYCGNPGRSKEHVWGQWLAKLLPSPSKHTSHMVIRNTSTGVRGLPGAMNRPGAPRRQQIKAPCKLCNNGWMRRTNEAATEVITRLISDGPGRMNEAERTAFAAWAVMFSMTKEWAAKDLVVTPQADREFLMHNASPPKNWAVLIGLYDGWRYEEATNHRAIRYDPKPGQTEANAQCNTFTLGATVCVTLGGAITDGPDVAAFADFHGLRVVWPFDVNSFQLGRNPISDDRWEAIAAFSDPDRSNFEMFDKFRQMQSERLFKR